MSSQVKICRKEEDNQFAFINGATLVAQFSGNISKYKWRVGASILYNFRHKHYIAQAFIFIEVFINNNRNNKVTLRECLNFAKCSPHNSGLKEASSSSLKDEESDVQRSRSYFLVVTQLVSIWDGIWTEVYYWLQVQHTFPWSHGCPQERLIPPFKKVTMTKTVGPLYKNTLCFRIHKLCFAKPLE